MTEKQRAFHRLAPHLVDMDVSDDGVIAYADRRFVLFHTPMFARLFEQMKDVTGPIIERKIEEFGVHAGKQIAAKMDDAFKDVSVQEIVRLLFASGFDIDALLAIRATGDEAMIEKICGYGMHAGWCGEIAIPAYEENERFVLDAQNSFESDSYGETGDQECAFLPGALKGMLLYYWDVDDLTVREETCECDGSDYCRIVVEHDA